MTITVSASDLKSAISRIGWACEKHTSVPILSCFRLTISPFVGHMEITANNMDVNATIKVPIHGGDASWKTCVNGALLEQILKLCKGGMITMGPVKDGLQINNRVVPVMDASDFPSDKESTPDSRITMPAPAWLKMWERLKFAVSTEETRYYLNGISLEVKDDSVIAIATDGHKMAVQTLDPAIHDISGEWVQQILPRALCGGIAKVIGKSKSPISMALSLDPLRIIVVHEEVRIVAKLIDGTFPDWRRVVPKHKSSFTAKISSFMAALDDVRMPDKGQYCVAMAQSNTGVTLRVTSAEFGSATAAVSGDFLAAEKMTDLVGFDYRYLMEALKIFEGDEIALGADSPVEPSVWRDPADPSYYVILMPMRV